MNKIEKDIVVGFQRIILIPKGNKIQSRFELSHQFLEAEKNHTKNHKNPKKNIKLYKIPIFVL